jgi:hypothetical protein
MSGEIQIQTTVDSVIRDEGSLDDDLSDVELEEEDRSSSLSEIEDKDAEPELDDDAEASDDLSNPSDDNDSEAETERLEESPHKLRVQKDVVLNSQNGSETYERTPSKLHKQIVADELCDDGRDGDALSDDDISAPDDSPESSSHEDIELDQNTTTAATSLNDSSGEGKRTLSTSDIDSRKRKRSIMAGSGLDDMEEPLPKRTGSVMNPGDEYAIEDEVDAEKGDTSNPISGNISGEENEEPQEDVPLAVTEEVVAEDEMAESVDTPISPKKRGRKKKKVLENGMHNDEDLDALPNGSLVNGGGDARNGEDDNAENEGDDEEAELALRNEEECKWHTGNIWALGTPRHITNLCAVEKKMNAFDQLGGIEKNFAVFRDRSVFSARKSTFAYNFVDFMTNGLNR